jgi:Mrp family chromosome partitioning ATPase/capsular polysaccharide biosynthesis protein
LRDYLRVLWRRKFIVLACALITPAVAVALALRQPALYRSSAQVAVRTQDLSSVLSGIPDPSFAYIDPVRFNQTQIALALGRDVATQVLQRARLPKMSPDALIGATTVTAAPDADVLTFSVTERTPWLAQHLANAYANQYTAFRSQYDTQAIAQALRDLNARIAQLKGAGGSRSQATATQLQDKADQLQTAQTLETSNAQVFQPASGAVQVEPKPVRYGALGFALGLVLGIGLAFLLEAFDTRVRSPDEIGERLGRPLLTRVGSVPRRMQRSDQLVMLADPNGHQAEAYRLLRTNLEFVNLDVAARSILVTSALEQEGKSTTAANLALALARAGRHVALVDLDLRRPYLHKFFNLEGRAGLTTVALGHARLDQALARIALTPDQRLAGTGRSNGHGRVDGILEVLPAGPVPPDPGEFVSTTAVANVLHDLRERFDTVIIDAPPLLHVGDALTLAPRVEAFIVVVRFRGARIGPLRELRRVLDTCPTPTLGVVLTGTDTRAEYGYSGGYHYQAKDEAREHERVR